jgi:hypothetical protein
VRPELEALIQTWHKKDQKALLVTWRRELDDALDMVPADVPVPSAAKTFAPDAARSGASIVTPMAFIFVTRSGRFVFPLEELGVAGARPINMIREGPTEVTFSHLGNETRFWFGEATVAGKHFYTTLDQLIEYRRQNPLPREPSVAPLSAADELAKFAALRDQGVITEQEFAAKKNQLLGL